MTDITPSDLTWADLKNIMDNSFDEIFVVNAEGTVVYVNEACERHYGLKPSNVIGKSINYLINEGYYWPPIAPVVLRKKKRLTLEQETNIGRKLLVTATPVFNRNNQISFIVMNSRDITQIEELKESLQKTSKLVEQYESEVSELRQKMPFEGYTSHSKAMKLCLETARKIARIDSTILILGESGTGKNVLTKTIHYLSSRRNGPFLSINCAAIPDHLIESELFGYCRGAFTGADKGGKKGLAELASGGTLFLDEIGDIPYATQAKLLQLIQEHQFIPLGGNCPKLVDLRIIAATNRNLAQLVQEQKFREDLYYRLNVFEIEIPPLRERQEDIVPLLYYFLNMFDSKYKTSHQFSPHALDILSGYAWPGNVREMEHLVERLVVTISEITIEPAHLPPKILSPLQPSSNRENLFSETLSRGLKADEERLIIQTYQELKSSYKVANSLKISQSKVSRIVRKYNAGLK
ncbi:sigma 54-interacting transcriptional regulator [Desulfosporosinus sp. PR]|uniref:sigma-54 interaction domain-containing protein n=1 Tax=Candidatus Desulfosporosinus nitrosoreducens TaxID=3401928 RepID=UPI0027FF6AA7|nr:sigma 54-interacting transcriptional regulator [Desulfosporosinus sp. PR]MDQ7095165.1 sigma 54-interacting transcriptional regulator [Desulfosporosinus sp. PR]